MPAVSIERFLKELEKLKRDMDAGKLKSGAYDQRLARGIQELRERGVDADRRQITAALGDAHQRGGITDSVKAHLEKRLGLGLAAAPPPRQAAGEPPGGPGGPA